MTRLRAAVALALIAASSNGTLASGAVGFYGIVERVVFEPDDRNPERLQVWGAFAYFASWSPTSISPVARGYLYFRVPADESAGTVRKEWADLRAVAGTGQAVAFGAWTSIGSFEALRPTVTSTQPPYLLESASNRAVADMRVRPASERPANPAAYQTNAGIVKLTVEGSHAAIIKQLQDALAR